MNRLRAFKNSLLLFLFGCLFWVNGQAFAEFKPITLLLVPGPSLQVPKAFWRRPEILSHEQVFSGSERKALLELGQTQVAQSQRLFLRSLSQVTLLRRWVQAQGLDFTLDLNSLGSVLSQPLEQYQWALKNTGKDQRVIVDDVTTQLIPGRVGEDLNLGVEQNEARGGKKVRIAVLDTGVDYKHPNLKPNLVREPGECDALQQYQDCLKKETPASCEKKWGTIDANQNGYPLDCSGWNVTTGRNAASDVFGGPDASDEVGHGTHLAGIIAAAANGRGIRGVTQNAEILPVKVIKSAPSAPIRPQSEDGSLPSTREAELKWSAAFADVIARGMLYAIRSQAEVINLSLGWPAAADSMLMRKMVELAIQRGIIVVAAAGNDSADSRVMPCQYDGVICVASHGPDGALSHFSNFGTFVDIAAPGLDILSTWPLQLRSVRFTAKAGFEYKNGTSMATPFVVGGVARLLAAGIPPKDIYPRLILGARASQTSEYKYLRSGNLDLVQSLAVTPQPLILQATKEPLRLSWDRKQPQIPFKIELKNYWSLAKNIEISAQVIQESGDSASHLSRDHWQLRDWKQGEQQSLQTDLVIDNPKLDGRLLVEFKVVTDGVAPRFFRVPLEVSVTVGRDSLDPEIQKFPILGGEVLPGAELRSVSALDGKTTQDYVAIQTGMGGKTFQLLRQEGKSYRIVAEGKLEAQGDLFLIQRLDLYQNGKTNYVFILRLPPAKAKKTPVFRLKFYDSDLRLQKTFEFDNQTAAISEQFKWLRIQGTRGSQLVPAWMAFGRAPLAEKPAEDPWEPNPEDPFFQRLYYLNYDLGGETVLENGKPSESKTESKAEVKTEDGLRSVEVPDPYTLVQILAQSPEQKALGELTLVLSRGEGYDLQFYEAPLRSQEIDLHSLKPLSFAEFRMLLGIRNSTELTPLDSQAQVTGTAFTSESDAGSKRTTLLQTYGPRGNTVHFLDQTQRPLSSLDSVTRVAGAFLGEHTGGIFAETHYRLQYHDLIRGESVATSLDRFSFLPSFIFSKTLFPVVAQVQGAPLGRDRLPGVHIPASLGVTDAVEIVLPIYNTSTGRLMGLAHPARLRFRADESCVSIGKSIAPDSDGPSALVFFCGDQFLRIPVLF